MKLLNLGCGTKTSDKPGVINIDWSVYLRLKRARVVQPLIPLLIRGDRLRRYHSLPDNVMVHNLANGIPFSNDSVDVVYHSHMLEHLDRQVVPDFLLEVRRVLKSGGIHRIVVPDLEHLCRAYIQHLSDCDADSNEWKHHDAYVDALLEQSVRKESDSTRRQGRARRFIENLVLGSARRRGETHQWMYDRINLAALLTNAGYQNIRIQQYDTSLISQWSEIGLDTDSTGAEYKPGSLYLEATVG